MVKTVLVLEFFGKYLVGASKEPCEDFLVLAIGVFLLDQLLPDVGGLRLEALDYSADEVFLLRRAFSTASLEGIGDSFCEGNIFIMSFLAKRRKKREFLTRKILRPIQWHGIS